MNKKLRVLHLEDEPDYTELVRSMFIQDGLDAEVGWIGDRAALEKALKEGSFDVVLSDYRMPSFTGLDALAMVREKYPHVPFILVSGTIGEQAAIESLKAGATDYLLKQHPDRLPSAVRRAVREARERARLRAVETELARREKYFRALTENSPDVLVILSREGNYIYVSASVERMKGYTPEELCGRSVFEFMHPEDVPPVKAALQFALDQPGRTMKIQYRHQNKHGEWRHLELVGQNRLQDPEIGGLVANCRDVTDPWRVEEELRNSEQQYRLLFHDNPNPMWVFDLETQAFLEVNEAAIQHYGYSREEFLTKTLADLRVTEKEGPPVSPLSETAGHNVIWRHRRKDGKLIDVEIFWSPIAFGDRFGALAIVTDVTERLRTEHRSAVFAKLGHRLSSATTHSEAAMIICEAADALFKWDDFALDLYFAERDEVFSLLAITMVGGQRVEIPSSPQPKTANALVQRVIRKGAELVSASKDKPLPSVTMLAPIRKGDLVIGVLFVQSQTPGAYAARDLEVMQTLADQCGGALERVRVEQDLRESQRRFRDLFENSPDAIFVEDLNGTVLDVNFAACVLHGLTREQLIGRNALNDLVPPARREGAHRDFQKLASGKLTWVEGESLTATGGVTPVEVRSGRVEYSGQPALLLHVRDISERRAAEAAVQSSEMLFRSVWENSVDGMRLTNGNGVIVAVNKAYCDLVGMEAEDMEGKLFTVVYAESEKLPDILEKYREHFQSRATNRKIQHQSTLHNGQMMVLEVTDSFIELHGQPLLLFSLFRDVTTQRRLEEQLRQSQKMEAIGQLAGGVAHDFNNILTVIHGHASLLLSVKLEESAVRSAQQITQAAERAAALTRQLLTFSRRQLIQPKKMDMNKIVNNMTDLFTRLLGEDVMLQLDYSLSAAMVEADVGMMEQVLLNLAVNARDAMPKGGQLAVRIAIVKVNHAHVERHPEARAGHFVSVSTSDTGCGIPPENIQRIFEPFFTTKEIGKGTGLGLATVYGIVKQHRGWIEVESAIGKGTTFRVYVPYAGSAQIEAEKPAAPVVVRGGSETILLVEDEKPVRELVFRILQKYGYQILQAGNGVEAIQTWNQHKDEISLLFTDLVMPDNMNGRELAEKLRIERPGLKVIFTSGYSSDIVGKDFKLEPELNFLQKPYQPQILALTVRRCLDERPD